MNFRKFISGVSALAIAASAFAGMAVTASAASSTVDQTLVGQRSFVGVNAGSDSTKYNQVLYMGCTAAEGGAGELYFKLDSSYNASNVTSAKLSLYLNSKGTFSQNVGVYLLDEKTYHRTNYTLVSETGLAAGHDVYTFGGTTTKRFDYASNSGVTKTAGLDAATTLNSLTADQYNDIDVTDLIKALANKSAGDEVYLGICLKGNNDNSNAYFAGFGSANAPKLSITYDDGSSPVYIGDTGYDSIEDAFVAAESGNTITLNDDCTTSSRFFMQSGATSAPNYYNELTSLTIDGDGHTLTLTGNSFTYLFSMVGKSGITLNLKDINIQDNRTSSNHYIVNSRNNVTINFTDVTLSNIDRTVIYTYAGSTGTKPTINISGLNVTSAADDKKIVENNSADHVAASTISLASALSGYTVNTIDNNEVLKAKTDSYWTFDAVEGLSYDTLKVNATINNEAKTATHKLDTAITGGTLGLTITGVPYGVTIDSITIE